MTTYESDSVDLREKLAHIDQMLADHDRKRQEIKFAPWQLVLTSVFGGITAAAAFFAAGAAFIKLLG
jgi:hypothetical protein